MCCETDPEVCPNTSGTNDTTNNLGIQEDTPVTLCTTKGNQFPHNQTNKVLQQEKLSQEQSTPEGTLPEPMLIMLQQNQSMQIHKTQNNKNN